VPLLLANLITRLFSALGKEREVLRELDQDVRATVRRMTDQDPGLEQLLDGAHAYAVFPSVGKATAVVGGAFGKGEVFRRNQLIGYAAVAQLTLGVQIGGQTFSEIIAFENAPALERFKLGKAAFAASASAVLVKAGAAASANYEKGVAVFVSSDGGMMLEAAIGAQKFFFKPAALGRTKKTPKPGKDARTGPDGKFSAARPARRKKNSDSPAERRPARRPGR
jgi:lipid-binding SYLF domain-containing protein